MCVVEGGAWSHSQIVLGQPHGQFIFWPVSWPICLLPVPCPISFWIVAWPIWWPIFGGPALQPICFSQSHGQFAFGQSVMANLPLASLPWPVCIWPVTVGTSAQSHGQLGFGWVHHATFTPATGPHLNLKASSLPNRLPDQTTDRLTRQQTAWPDNRLPDQTTDCLTRQMHKPNGLPNTVNVLANWPAWLNHCFSQMDSLIRQLFEPKELPDYTQSPK